MDKLIALPIKGESFLLRRGGKAVLVDGGYNSRDLASALKTHAADLKRIDIVVCTHADRDHAGGLSDLIRTSGLTVGEFWLPGSWADSIPELITEPRATIKGLVSELDKLPWQLQRRRGDAEEIADFLEARAAEERKVLHRERLWSESILEVGQDASDGRWGSLIQLRDAFVNNERIPPRAFEEWIRHTGRDAFEWGRRQIRRRQDRYTVSYDAASYWLELIHTAQLIHAIAAQALIHGVRVRWFDYGTFALSRIAKGGDSGFLEPLNSVELQPPPPQMLSYLARLSPVNEECLAFLAPPLDDEGLGVVFCGDSPLGDGPKYANSFLTQKQLPSDFPVVATAPHHGSEQNQPAYGHLKSWANVWLWLRSGGSKKQPGLTYKALPSSERACTHCPQIGLTLREASIHLSRRHPCLRVSSHDCVCV
ncbi:TPA: MBL fold metallo-hydrolase [Pseudomonas aeruginosa]|uniref:MBL fold metallo-hydrolase n=1 Tax=Pseudomonas aeruginosa TaxID=287 RepID=UPI001CC10C22|nr:MBL fold metallo-hydrolase [Pseudomonas aeruginosa]HBO2993431.1 MBL fold metallo-hydrolase [Pseudomonas aeruginosa]HBO5656583.1 MBL fold metallo-hydrolase [Pseudomonas aeruginosa]HCI1863546.1 MBL fold metallo-hydrolase [Pseudomonas aeruginosa]HCI2647572.1 MBL fold metallo-hydrolase [Pseudomonas aeruginosa]